MYIQCCRLTLHENLFYATREIGRLYETGRYLHNYGLTYALGLASSPYFNASAVPRYADDLQQVNESRVYITPARPLAVEVELNTFKYADNRYRVKMEPGSRNTPSFGRAKELAVGSTFAFAVLSERPVPLPKWIRLGKWMSKAELSVVYTEEIAAPRQGEGVSAFPLNPLDLPDDVTLQGYDLISMPPVSLLDHAHFDGPYFQLADATRSQIPAGLRFRFSGLL